MIDAINGSWLQTITEQLSGGTVNGSWIQGWAQSMNITQTVNGSWEEAIILHIVGPTYTLNNGSLIQTISQNYGAFQPLNGSWIQALAQMIYDSYTNPHISEWLTTVPNETVTLPYVIIGSYVGIIDWGDGTTSENTYDNRTHTYVTPGYYNITIYGRVRGFRFNNSGDKDKIYRILSWGSGFNLGTGGSQFYGCANLNLSEVSDVLQVYNPGQNLNAQTRNFTNMFRESTSLTTINRVNEWDMSNVTNLSGCFLKASNFNDNLNGWNTSSVTIMLQMFFQATNFDGDITTWDTSNVTNFGQMFYLATSFNSPIGGWDVSNGITFSNMFRNASSFDRDLSNWDTSSATDMTAMFYVATSFNYDVNNWDMSNVTDIDNMFRNATAFNKPLNNWNIGSVTLATSFMLSKTHLNYSSANYDSLLIGWASQTVQPNLFISFGTIKRTTASDAAKAILTSAPNNWTITDGGYV
jgi:surface protein